jgi:cysteine-rich repeat protein
MCGDLVQVGDEECEDGNFNGGDGCDQSCRVEKHWRCVKRSNVFTAQGTPFGKWSCAPLPSCGVYGTVPLGTNSKKSHCPSRICPISIHNVENVSEEMRSSYHFYIGTVWYPQQVKPLCDELLISYVVRLLCDEILISYVYRHDFVPAAGGVCWRKYLHLVPTRV